MSVRQASNPNSITVRLLFETNVQFLLYAHILRRCVVAINPLDWNATTYITRAKLNASTVYVRRPYLALKEFHLFWLRF